MKKIMSKAEKEKRDKTIKIIVGGFLIFIMFFSTMGFIFTFAGTGGTGTTGVTEDYYFDGTQWVMQSGGQAFYFNNNIEDVRDIPLEIQSRLIDFSGKILYIDSQNEDSLSLFSRNLGRYVLDVQPACYEDCEDLPKIDCSQNLIVLRAGEEERVYQEDKCIFIESERGVDAFLYKILGFT